VILAISDYFGPLDFAMDAASFYWPGLVLTLFAGLALVWRRDRTQSKSWLWAVIGLAACSLMTLMALASRVFARDMVGWTFSFPLQMMAPFIASTMLVEVLLLVLVRVRSAEIVLFVTSSLFITFTIGEWLYITPQYEGVIRLMIRPGVLPYLAWSMVTAFMGVTVSTAVWLTIRRVRGCT
jgi:hypothetical protein